MLNAATLRQLDLLEIGSRRSYLGSRQGRLLSPKRGHGIEFSDYREYQPGDNPRYLDWALFARSDRLYVKTYHEEQNLSVLILIDTSSSMLFKHKWEKVTELVLSLSYIALKNQHSLQVAGLGSFQVKGRSPGETLVRVEKELNKLINDENIYNHDQHPRYVKQALSQIRFPGVCIYISDFLHELKTTDDILKILRAKNLDITAIQVLGEEDLSVEEGEILDSESSKEITISLENNGSKEYEALLNQHTHKVRELCNKSGISFANYTRREEENSNNELIKFLSNNLIETGLIG